MVSRKAVINAGVVENVILAADDFTLPDRELVALPDDVAVSPGWTYADGEFSPPAPPAPTADQVNAERERRILTGKAVSVTGVGDVLLQGRPEDQVNMLGLKDTARDLKAAGVTAAVIPFRDGDNIVRMFTPDQMIEAVDKGKQHVSAVYQAAWALKELDPIPADYADYAYWPA